MSETAGYGSAGGIARLTLPRPDKLNGSTTAMLKAPRRAVDRAASDETVLALTASGRVFSAGDVGFELHVLKPALHHVAEVWRRSQALFMRAVL